MEHFVEWLHDQLCNDVAAAAMAGGQNDSKGACLAEDVAAPMAEGNQLHDEASMTTPTVVMGPSEPAQARMQGSRAS